MADYIIRAAARSNWIVGTIDGLRFGIKVYDVGSRFGIDGGRVSKLNVNDSDNRTMLISYDRGWDIKPKTDAHQDLLNALLRFADSLPKQEVWEQTFREPLYFFVDEENVLEVEPDNLT